MRKVLVFLMMFAFIFAGCSMFISDDDDKKEETATAISFSETYITIENGGNTYLKYTVLPVSIQNKSDVRFSYDESIISIDADRYGVVITGKKSGQTYLKGTINGITATCLVTVEGNPDIYEGDPYIYSNFTVLELTPGSSTTVQASLYGGTSTDLEDFVWSIKNDEIASINYARGSCVVTAKHTGSTQITVSHPKCEFPYTMVLYVYADELNEAYITTSQNIVVINKAETLSRTVTFEVKNPYSANYQSGFSYEVVSESGNPTFSVVGNGNTAIITPLKNGLSVLRVKHSMCEYMLDVLVKVSTAIENIYIVPSASVLEVVGSETSYSVYADITGTTKYVDPDKFEWEVLENDEGSSSADCMDWSVSGNQFSVQGKKNGAFKVKVSHELSEYSRTILVVLREQAGSAIDASMYITTTANYVQTKVGGETEQISVQLMGGEIGDENDLVWTIDNGENNDICKIVTPTGNISARSAGSVTDGYLYITPLKAGTATVSVSHPKILYSTDIVVKVLSEYALLEEPVYITSDLSLVRILNGTTQEVSVELSGNVSSGDENGIFWESENSSAVSVSPSTGKTVVLSAYGSGQSQTYIKASHEKALSEKKILVLCADTQEELDSMKGFYADTTYFRLNENGTAKIEMKSFGLEESDFQKIKWTSGDSSVCSVEADSTNRLNANVHGYKSGETTVTANLDGCEPCVFSVTVLPEGEDTGVILPRYLTTAKNAVVITEVGGTASLSVSGVNISDSDMASKTEWKSENEEIASITGNGESAVVTAVKEGNTRIKVSNSVSNNVLYIDVKVGALYEWADDFYVYITTEEDTVTMIKGETRTIGAALENSTAKNGFSFSSAKTDIVEATGSADGVCFLEAKEAGMSELLIRNVNADFEKTVLVVVANSQEELDGIKYLTTTQNVVTVGESYNQLVSVSIENANDEILNGYNWQSSDSSVVNVIGSGSHAVFYGIKCGTAKITVTNDYCEYPLEIIANCVDPVLAASNPYITCQNIVTLYVGDDATTLTADLVGGSESDYQNFTWTVQNPEICSLYSSNETAQIKAVKEGTTQIVISHPKAGGIDRTVLVICEPKVQTDCYITVTESIIKMAPSDSSKTINATLVNGIESDAYNFKWWADSYDIIDMNYTSESCVITPIATGNTTVHCSHPKAAYQKDIVLYISQYSEFAFAQSSVSIKKGKQTFVNMEVPTTNVKTKVVYSVKGTDGSSVSDIVGASGTNSVCILEPRQEGSCIVCADLVAVNSGIVQSSAQLLVNIEASSEEQTYINYSGSTIINIEKGEVQTLSATLAGDKAQAGDEKYLKWKVSDEKIISISPSPSASGYSMNNEVQIKGLQAGKEATITISHEKADSNVILYVIVPGENVANILLDRTAMNLIQGDSAQYITATITNAQEDDYENLKWEVRQDEANPVVKVSGSGKKISVLPKNIGSAVITATVPSSLRKATCTVSVEPPKTITFDKTSVRCYPGEVFTIKYKVSPENETSSVSWTTSDSSYVTIKDDNNGTLTCIGKYNEGTTSIKATTKSYATAVCNVTNGWGNSLSLSKSMIKTVPVDNGDGTFTIDYEVRPACAELHILNVIDTKIELKDGTYSSKIDKSNSSDGSSMYVIKPEKFDSVDTETGYAYGKIILVPKGEHNGVMQVQAYNPTSIDGKAPLGVVETKNVELKIYYTEHTFSLKNFSSNGKWSSFDSANGIMTLGDGETSSFTVSCDQKNATPQIQGAVIQWSNFSVLSEKLKSKKTASDGTASDTYMVYTKESGGKTVPDSDTNRYVISKTGSSNAYTIRVCDDFKSGQYYGTVSDTTSSLEQQYNTTRLEHLYCGTLMITYQPVYAGSTEGKKTFSFPVYLDIRNCLYSYK